MSATTRTTHPSAEAPPVRTTRPHRWVAGALVLAILAVVFTFFLTTYAVHRYKVPLGWDSPKYLWRTKLAALTGVTHLPSHLPPPINANPDRPGFPTLAL